MFEIILRLIELILEGGKRIKEEKQQERRRSMGTALLSSYLRILEVVATGYALIRELEHYVERGERYRQTGERFSYGMYEVQVLCNQQGVNLSRLSVSISDALPYLAVLDPDAVQELSRFVAGKMHAVWRLANLIGTGHYYIGSGSVADLVPELRVDQWRLAEDRALKVFLRMKEDSVRVENPAREVFLRMKEDSVRVEDRWSFEPLDRVKSYLQEQKPTQQLDLLKQSAMKLRQIIVENLSLDEILWTLDAIPTGDRYIFHDDVERSKYLYEPLSKEFGADEGNSRDA